MEPRTEGKWLVVLLFVVLIITLLPTQNAAVKHIHNPTGPNYIFHYVRSLSCAIVPYGVSYWNGDLILGCGGPSAS